MKIALTLNGQTLNSKVSKSFEFCKYLLVVETDDLSITAAIKNNPENKGHLAGEVINFDCEAVITGELDYDNFIIIADAGVTRYLGEGRTAKEALELMNDDELAYIRNPEGTDECSGDHGHGECHDHDHGDPECDGDCSGCSGCS